MPCQFFNQCYCSHANTHGTRGTLYKHVCAFWVVSSNKIFPHSEMDCRNKKNASSKNKEVICQKSVNYKELHASPASWSHRYCHSKAYTTKVDNRSYVQVLADSKSTHFPSKFSKNLNDNQFFLHIPTY